VQGVRRPGAANFHNLSLQANARYLDALAAVDDPTKAKRALERLTTLTGR